ncbi:MAG: hypothetical protein KGI27_15805, partial [Thaumarchaeota archaeon]|nr:hypothetical protein [Nitrososphaerota archaeon]
MPITMGAAMGNALSGSQQYNQQVLQNAMARLQLGYKNWLLNQMGVQQAQPSQSLSDLNQGQTQPATPSAKQLKDLSQASDGNQSAAPVGNLLLSSSPGSALTMPAASSTNAASQTAPRQTALDSQQGLFPGMNPTERIAMLSALFTNP